MENPSLHKAQISRYDQQEVMETDDFLVVEEPLEITISALESKPILHKKPVSITMRTPAHDKELAIGFLYGEGMLTSKNQIKNIRQEENKIDIVLHKGVHIDLKKLDRHFYTTSSCGVCGKASIESLEVTKPVVISPYKLSITTSTTLNLPDLLRKNQTLFTQTGGIHAAGLFSQDGHLLCLREDVGRHNAMDKLIGYYFLESKLPLDQSILVLSGRASFELLQKAIMAGIQIVISIGAPSSLALALSQKYNITLIGFVKGKRFNIYHGKQRIIL